MEIPYYEYLGIVVEPTELGVRTYLRFPDLLGNSRGELHGGAVASLLDATLSQSVKRHYPPETPVATVDLSITYLLPTRGEVYALGEIVRTGKTLAFASAAVHDPDGNVVARASGTFRVRA